MLKRFILAIALLALAEGPLWAQEVAAPSLNSLTATAPGLSQTVAPLLGRAFTLTINGQNFTNYAIVSIGGVPLPTQYVNSTQLNVTVSEQVLATKGIQNVKVEDSSTLMSSNVLPLVVVERGDVNATNTVTIADALVAALNAGENIKPPLAKAVADANLSEANTIADALVIARFTGGLIANLPTPLIVWVPPATRDLPLVITGEGFSETAGNQEVLFSTEGGGVVRVMPFQATTTTLNVIVPVNAVSGVIQVYRLDAPMGSGEFALEVSGTPTPLLLTGVNPFFNVSPGQVITLTGLGFDPIPANNTVQFLTAAGVVNVVPSQATTTSLTVQIPSGVQCGGITASTVGRVSRPKAIVPVSVGVECPVILTDLLGGAAPGQVSVIEGAGFDVTTPSANVVLFPGPGGSTIQAQVLMAGRTQLHVRIPAGAIAGDVTISARGQTSNPVRYGPTSTLPPTLISISPTSGVPGSSVLATLTGTNFRVGATSVTVSGTGVTIAGFNVVDENFVKVTLTIPLTASPGPRTLSVTTAGGSTLPVTFTVNAATIESFEFVDPVTGLVTNQFYVDKNNSVQIRLQIVDSAHVTRSDVVASYTITNPEVASVESGVITGLKTGFTTIRAECCSGKSAIATVSVVEVKPAPEQSEIRGLSLDPAGRLYLTSPIDNTILIKEAGATTSTLYAGVPAAQGGFDDKSKTRLESHFNNPSFLAVDPNDNVLYISDSGNNMIRRILSDGRVETFAGRVSRTAGSQDGPGDTAAFNNPQGIAIDSAGYLWVADSGNHTIRRINIATRIVETVAGLANSPGFADGVGSNARFNGPMGITIEPELIQTKLERFRLGGAPPAPSILVADAGNGAVRRVRSNGMVEPLELTGAFSLSSSSPKSVTPVFAANMRFNEPQAIAADVFGHIYLIDSSGQINVIVLSSHRVSSLSPLAGSTPKSILISPSGALLLGDAGGAHEIKYAPPEILTKNPEPTSGMTTPVLIKGKNFSPETVLAANGIVIPAADMEIHDTETIFLNKTPVVDGPVILSIVNRGGSQDITPPHLADLRFVPGFMDTKSESVILTAGFSLEDDLSGAAAISIVLRSPSGNQSRSGRAEFRARTSVTSALSITFPQFSEAGRWSVASLTIEDAVGNTQTLSTTDIAARGFLTEIDVDSDGDVTAPTLTGLTFDPTSVDTRFNSAPVTIHFNASDERSGVKSVTVALRSPTSGQVQVGRGVFEPTKTASGSLTITIPQYSEAGVWVVDHVSLEDAVGNTQFLTTAQVAAIGGATQLNVTSNPDIAPPQLMSLTFSQQPIDTSVGAVPLQIAFRVTDSLSGATSFHIRFVSPTGRQTRFFETFFDASKDFQRTISGTFPQFSEAGVWLVNTVFVRDAAGNSRYYTTAELAALGAGFDTQLTVGYGAIPSVAGINPVNARIDSTVAAVIQGANLSGASAVTFSGTGVTAKVGNGGTSTSLPIVLTVSPSAALEVRSFTVTTPNGTSAPFEGFSLSLPTVMSVSTNAQSPGVKVAQVVRGTSGVLTITGTGLQGTTGLDFLPSGLIASVGAPTVSPDGHVVTVPLTVSVNAPLGVYQVQVIIPTLCAVCRVSEAFIQVKTALDAPITLTTAGGENQIGAKELPLPNPLVVLARENGVPVGGLHVTFTATSGGGSVRPVSSGPIASVPSLVTTTTSTGLASAIGVFGPTTATHTYTATLIDGLPLSVTFSANAATARLESVSSRIISNTVQGVPLTLTGTSLSGGTVKFLNASTQALAPITYTVVGQTDTEIRLTLSGTGALQAGDYAVSVETPTHGTTNGLALQLSGNAPLLTSVDPAVVATDSSNIPFQLSGTNLVPGPVEFRQNGISPPYISLQGITFTATRILGTFVVNPQTPAGDYIVTLNSPATGMSNGLTVSVIAAANSTKIVSISPLILGSPGTASITINGQNLTGAELLFKINNQASLGIQASNVVNTSGSLITADVTVLPNAVLGTHVLTVKKPTGNTSNGVGIQVRGTGPLISQLSPSVVRTYSSNIPFQIDGTNLSGGVVQVRLNNTLATAVFVSGVATSPTQILGTLTVGGNAPAGTYVVNVFGSSGQISNALNLVVNNPIQPTLASITPNYGVQGTSANVTLIGSDFVQGFTTASVAGTGVTISNVNVSGSENSLTATLTIAANATTGPRNVVVTTPGGTSGSVTFTVNLAGTPEALNWMQLVPTGGVPGASGFHSMFDPNTDRMIVPGSGANTKNIWILEHADGLGGAPVWLNPATLPDPINGFPPTRGLESRLYDAAGNRMIMFGGCLANCLPAANDVWVLTNANGFGGSPTWSKLLPTGTAPTPRAGHDTVYDPGSNRMIVFGGQDGCCNPQHPLSEVWILTNANGLGGTPAWIQLSPSGGFPTGLVSSAVAYDQANNRMTIFGGSGSTNDTTNAVWVLSNANGLGGSPAWTNLIAEGALGSPSKRNYLGSVYDAATNRMTIFGGCLGLCASSANDVWILTNANGLGPAAWTQALPSGGPPATRNFHAAVLNPVSKRMTVFGGNGAAGALTDTWVLAGANGTSFIPSLTSINPTSGVQGGSLTVTLNGTNFISGATTIAVSGTGVIASAVNVAGNGNSLTATLTIAANAAIGARNVAVTTPGGTSGPVTFTVNPPAPTLSSITPSNGTVGQSVSVTLAGSNFIPGAIAVAISGTGVTASNVNVASGASLTATLTIASDAAIGTRAVAVFTSGGSSGTVGFVVNPLPPVLSSISPNSGVQGTSTNVTLVGTNFIQGATIVSISGAGVTASNVSVAGDGNSLTASLTLTANAALGARNVTVTTPGGTSGAVAFTVNPPPPVLSSIAPNYGTQGSGVKVALSGSSFVSGATTVSISGTGVTGSAVTVSSSTSMTVIFTIEDDAVATSHDVTVSTAGGTSGVVNFIVATGYTANAFVGPTTGPGYTDATGASARFAQPHFVWGDGTNLYVSDSFNHAIRRVVIATGDVSTFAGRAGSRGSTDGIGSAARFNQPQGIWGDGTNLYIADSSNYTIRKIVIATGAVSTLAGLAGSNNTTNGTGAAARFTAPYGIWGDGTKLYVVEKGFHSNIRVIVMATGEVSTLITNADFSFAEGVWGDGANLYVADTQNHVIQKIDIATGARTILAGSLGIGGTSDGTGSAAGFDNPRGVWGDGTNLYVTDTYNQTIRRIVITSGAVSTIAGSADLNGVTDGTGSAARFSNPIGIWGDGTNLYVADSNSTKIRQIVIGTAAVTTIAGQTVSFGSIDATGAAARFAYPRGVWGDGTNLYIADTLNCKIRRAVIATTVVSTLAGQASCGSTDATGAAARFNQPIGIWGDGTNLYVADSQNHTIRRIGIATGDVSTLAGLAGNSGSTDGAGAIARFNRPWGIWGDGANLYVADSSNYTIRKIVIATADVSTLAGQAGVSGTSNGIGVNAHFLGPQGIWGDGANLYVTDPYTCTIRKIVIPTGAVSTFAGSNCGSEDGIAALARFAPSGIWGDGTSLYVGDAFNQTIRRIDIAGVVSTLVGKAGAVGSENGSGPVARFNYPEGIWGDGTNLYVAETTNSTIRKVTPIPLPTLSAITPNTGPRGQDVGVTLTGSSFVAGATSVSISGTGITTSAVNVAGDGNSLTATLTLASDAALNARTVTVATYVGTSGSVTFTVIPAVPTLTSITPNSGGQSQSVGVTLTGSTFIVGATTVSVSGTGVTVSGVSVAGNGNSLTATLTIAADAGLGARNVTVTTASGTSNATTFTVTVPPPSLSVITPYQGAAGQRVMTLTGSNFIAGATTISIAGTGITVGTTSVVSGGSSLTATLTVNANAVLGDRSVTVATPGGTSNALTFSVMNTTPTYYVNTIGGSVFGPGYTDDTGTAARFSNPAGVWSDGTNLYVADDDNGTIRKVVISTGVVTTLAGQSGSFGSTNGVGSNARFNSPTGIWGDGTNLYVTDGNLIRKVVIATKTVTTFTTISGFGWGIWGDGTNLYVADYYEFTIQKIVIATGAQSTFAGQANNYGSNDGIGTAALFSEVQGLWGDGTNLYVADWTNSIIRKIVLQTAQVSTFAGTAEIYGSTDGVGAAAQFYLPNAIWGDGTNLYVTEEGNCAIRKIVVASATVSTIAGSADFCDYVDGTGSAARFEYSKGIWGVTGSLYVTDVHRIRKVVAATGVVSTFAGQSAQSGSLDDYFGRYNYPGGISGDGAYLYVADTENNTIRKVIPNDHSSVVSTVAGTAGTFGAIDAVGAAARFHAPHAVWSDGTDLYVADTFNHTIRKILGSTGAVSTLAGLAGNSGASDGIGTAARFKDPYGIWGDGPNLYVADTYNHVIRKITIATGAVSTLAGVAGSFGSADGTVAARFKYPQGIWGDGTNLYVTDNSSTIRKIVIATGAVTTIAGVAGSFGSADGTGTAARFDEPMGIVGDGTNLYIADQYNQTIRRVVIATGAVTTIAGTVDTVGAEGGSLTASRFDYPEGIWTDGHYIYVTDTYGHAIRKLNPSYEPIVSSITPNIGARGQNIPVTLAGYNFVPGATTISISGTGVTASSPNVANDGTSLTTTLTLASNATIAARTVTVTTSAGTSGAVFTVNYPPPTLSSITPNNAGQNQSFTVTLTGTNFVVGATTIAISGTSSDIAVSAINVAANGNSLTATFTVSSSAFPAVRNVTVSTAGGTSTSVTFTVTGFALTTYAGSIGGPGYVDGIGTAARFSGPTGLGWIGSDLIVTDTLNHTIRRISSFSGSVFTFAGQAGTSGSTDGTFTTGRFYNPGAICSIGVTQYVVDTSNHTIRGVGGTLVTTVAGSAGIASWADGNTGATVRFNSPNGIWCDQILYVADTGNHVIRQVYGSGETFTIAGIHNSSGSTNGPGASAQFSSPEGIWGDATALYVADTGNGSIRKILRSDFSVTTLATGIFSPHGIWGDGTYLYVTGQNVIWRVAIVGGAKSIWVGSTSSSSGSADGIGAAALFNQPRAVTGDGTNLYVADSSNNTIRKIVIATGAVSTIAGLANTRGSTDGTGTAAAFYSPGGIAGDGTNIYVADSTNSTIRQIVRSTGAVTTLAGVVGSFAFVNGNGTSAKFSLPLGLWSDGTNLYVADSNNNAIRKVVIASGAVTTLATGFSGPSGVWGDATNLYVTDLNGVKKVVISNGAVTTLATGFTNPQGIWGDGTNLYVASNGDGTIRRVVIATGVVSIFAGASGNFASTDGIGSAARFYGPNGITGDGTSLYVSDIGSHTIRKIVIATAAVTTLAGQPYAIGYDNGTGLATRFYSPTAIWSDGTNLYVADSGNNAIRKMTPLP